MKISIDATGLGGVKTGTAVYLTEILQVWNEDLSTVHSFVIFTSPKASGYLETLGLDSRFSLVEAPDSRLVRIFWQQLVMPWHLWRLGIDVHWGCGFVLPLLSRRRMVVTIYDLTFQLFPAVHERVKRYYFPLMIAAAVSKAKRVLAISQTTRNDLHQHLPESRGKTEVTLLAPRAFPRMAANSESIVEKLSGNRYLICLGTLEPRKNLRRLFDAWLDIKPSERLGIKLVVVGVRGWMMELVTSQQHEAENSMVFTGFLEDAELNHLLGGALALAYPSLYEGFGLPVLEAMSQGVPVLTSHIGATKEISGAAALLVDVTDILAIKTGLLQLISDASLRERLSVLGLKRAAQFSWEQTARQTMSVLEQAEAFKA